MTAVAEPISRDRGGALLWLLLAAAAAWGVAVGLTLAATWGGR